MKKKKQGKEKKLLLSEAYGIFSKNPTKQFNYKQVAAQLGIVHQSEKVLLMVILEEMAEKGLLLEKGAGKFCLKNKGNVVIGKVEITQSGNAYVISEESDQDTLVKQRNLKGAFNGDIVSVHLYPSRSGSKPEGEVAEIIKRGKTEFVGTLQVSKNFAFLIPDNSRNPFDIFIPLDKLMDAFDGDKAVARIVEWNNGRTNPTGEIIKVLGKAGEHKTEMHAILAEYGLPEEFEPKVEQAAKEISPIITEQEIAKRKDFRKITTFTIDPVDAKDFDDALSIRKLPGEKWEIGIHIADVSHYVKPNTVLEEEAYNRATSVYLVDRVVPMLPEMLSNNLCSLRPNEEKLCFSAVFEMDEEARIHSEWFGRTVILSDRRFSYEEAQQVLETKEGDYAEELLTLNRLAGLLRKQRFKKGSIAFDKVEVKFNLDQSGKPTGVYFKEAKDSNKLIEDFMLLANRKVAEYVGAGAHQKTAQGHAEMAKGKGARTFVYRIHDRPDQEKLQSFSMLVKGLGYSLKTSNHKEIATSLNQLLVDVKGKKEQGMVEQLAIRTMAKAVYSTDNIGHYGLAFDHYTHFTSPIRRYPDVMVHRLLQYYLDIDQGKTPPFTITDPRILEDQCKHSSDMEKLAADAERSSIKYKQVEFLQDKIGNAFEGIISGVTEWGLFVEIIENGCEGLVRLRSMEDDHYVYDEEKHRIVGKRSKKMYQLGDKVRIEVKRADLPKKQLDFKLVDRDYF
jgi:ribonuclease R